MKTKEYTLGDAINGTLGSSGWSMESSRPASGVEDDWPHVAYGVTIKKGGKIVLTTKFKMGVGHFLKGITNRACNLSRSQGLENALRTIKNKPHDSLVDKDLHARAAQYMAQQRKISPSLADVMHSLLSDGSAYFDGFTFEDWAGEFGYDPDSIKARKMWEACDETGRLISRALGGASEIEALRELFQDY
jgi:hypothetical protein